MNGLVFWIVLMLSEEAAAAGHTDWSHFAVDSLDLSEQHDNV